MNILAFKYFQEVERKWYGMLNKDSIWIRFQDWWCVVLR